MKTVVVEDFGPSEQVRVVDKMLPEPGAEDVLIRVAGAAVNWIDVSLRAGRLADSGLLAPAVEYGMGWDVAGVVEAVGPKVDDHAIGAPVIGLRDVLGLPGTHAEYVALHRDAVVPAPAKVDLVDAGSLPLAGVTALGAIASAGLSAGDRLLVTGAAGVVGRMCVAVARTRGIHVIAVGRGVEAAGLTAPGTDVLTGNGPLAARVRDVAPAGVDAVIDTASLGASAHEALRGEGTFVALVRPLAPLSLRGTRVVVHEAWADPAALAELVDLVDAGVIQVPATHRYPLDAAAEAHRVMEEGGIRGRVVLEP